MTTVFESSIGVEAHMISHLLERAGIANQVLGEYLQGAMGELPPAGLVRVVVEDSRAVEAREVIREWERAQPSIVPELERATSKATAGLSFVFVATGAFIGAALTWLALRTPAFQDRYDYDQDGIVDQVLIYAGNVIVRDESDRNADQKLDLIYTFSRGTTTAGREDNDFDGRFETVATYEKEQPVLARTDLDGDGTTDIACRSVFGVVSGCDFLSADGRSVVKTERYTGGQLTSTHRDTNGDGQLDRSVQFDAMREPIGER
jgi:hypothetical protein